MPTEQSCGCVTSNGHIIFGNQCKRTSPKSMCDLDVRCRSKLSAHAHTAIAGYVTLRLGAPVTAMGAKLDRVRYAMAAILCRGITLAQSFYAATLDQPGWNDDAPLFLRSALHEVHEGVHCSSADIREGEGHGSQTPLFGFVAVDTHDG